MTHAGVLFVTTNNAYDAAHRLPGVDGFNALFAQQIRQFPTKWVQRSKAASTNHTTCHQAEVLYPDAVPVKYLKKIYVPTADISCEVEAQVSFFETSLHPDFQLVVAPEHFG
jgi:hypothetical protein